jgi:phosphoribosylanthranilate isomerase
MWIKICANTNPADAKAAAELGADAVGFVFAKSKRQVGAEQADAIVSQLPKRVEKVGVFDLDDPYGIEHYVACCGLTAAQLHRPYDAELVRLLAEESSGGALKIIQTVAYELDATDRAGSDTKFVQMLKAVFADRHVWAVLLDAKRGGESGGLGVAFDWAHVAGLVELAISGPKTRPRVILAGGLNAENVAQAVAELRPWGVDVASGVERSPGMKDRQKLKSFLENARAAGRQAGA